MNENKLNNIPQFWAAISHEIRTPLNVIKGMTDISEKEIYDVELVKECLAKIKDSTEKMQMVTNSLIDYAAIAQENIEIQKEKIDFKTLITDIAMHSYLLAKQKKCHFNMHIQDVTEEALIGDEGRISQVLLALLNVVVHYTVSEGMIDFTVQQIGISNAKVFMRFCLRSTALMFPEDIVKYINDEEAYSDPDRLVPGGAFGITEMNALYFAHLMGGKIQALNQSVDYSEIVFDMEFGRTEQPFSITGTKLFSNQRILIVADTQNICEERGQMLVDMGMQYESATENDEALEKIGEAENSGRPFTICILDWDMEHGKCTQLIKEIRDVFGKEMTILVTAHEPQAHQKEAQHIGANYVIERTLFRSTLFDALISVEKGIQLQHEITEDTAYDFRGNNVLVAEDVALNMEVITKLLARVNIEVTCVSNGMEALTQFEKKPAGYFGTIFLDINMPVMDGYETVERIRKSDKSDAATVPIYAMTANAFKEDVEKALQSGMDGHIAKPIDVNALYRILNHTLRKKEDSELEQLRDLAEQDPLTGCLNRRGFEKCINELMQGEEPLAYAIIDIDDFKQVNDQFGHEVGDSIIKKVVRVVKKKMRNNDYFVRLGGDEFVAIFANYKKNAAFLIKRMDEANDELLHPNDGMPPVTISVGVVLSKSGYTETLYTTADKALYNSKNIGKGCCTVLNDGAEQFQEAEKEDLLFSDRVHYMNDQLRAIVDRKQHMQSVVMLKNKPVGFANGYYEKGLPIYSFNGFFTEMLGYTIEEFKEIGKNGFSSFVHIDDRKNGLAYVEMDKVMDERIRLSLKGGDYLWFNVDYIVTKTKDDRKFWMASFRNIDDHLVGSLCADDYRMVAIIDPEQDTLVIEKGAYLVSEKELHIQKKYNYSTLIAEAIQETIREDDRESYLEKTTIKNICQKMAVDGMYEYTVYQKWGSLDYCIVRHKYRYMNNLHKSILCTWEFLGIQAENDELTDVFNENGFYRIVEGYLKDAISVKESYAILYFNISGFKAWNSMLGREDADLLLKYTAQKIKKSKLNPLAVCRLFSDHFVCLVKRAFCDMDIVSQLCNCNYEIAGNNINVQVRCGIFYIDDVNESVRSMCDKAKLAKTQITNEHAVPYHIYDHVLNERYIQQKHVLSQVTHALNRKEIMVYYQPIIEAKTGLIEEAEALIRWMLPGGRVLEPGIFIPALEEQGFIADVDSYVQEQVGTMIERRKKNHKRIVPISVNVSRMDFLNSEFVGKLKKFISEMEHVNQYMRVEVTESSFTEVGQTGSDLLKGLREQGIKIMMDDFGIGFSTLSGITSQQFDIVKIDMSFVNGIGKANGSEAIIQNVISMCHALNMKVVAEGVETEAQYQFLMKAECDYLQGFYFYKPMSEEDFEMLLDHSTISPHK